MLDSDSMDVASNSEWNTDEMQSQNKAMCSTNIAAKLVFTMEYNVVRNNVCKEVRFGILTFCFRFSTYIVENITFKFLVRH